MQEEDFGKVITEFREKNGFTKMFFIAIKDGRFHWSAEDDIWSLGALAMADKLITKNIMDEINMKVGGALNK